MKEVKHKDNTLYDSFCMKCLEYGFLFWREENILEVDSGGGSTVTCIR